MSPLPRPRHTLARTSPGLVLALHGLALHGLALVGCGGAGTVEDAGPQPDGALVFLDTLDEGCHGQPIYGGPATELAEVGLTGGDPSAFTAWHDGDRVAFVWGFQGGTMITPTVRAPLSIARPGNPCVLVDLENLEPDGAHVFEGYPSYVTRLDAPTVDGRLVLEGLFDQLGVTSIPEATPLVLDVTVRGTAGAAHTRVMLSIVSSTTLPEHCTSLPTTGVGCVYRAIPATGTVTAIRPRTDADPPPCPGASDASMVEYTLAIDEAYRDCTSAEPHTETLLVNYYAPATACVEAAGLAVGSTFAVTYDEILGGTCPPVTLEPHAFDAAPCAACTSP